ncbi:MAG: hypothetical protein ACLFU6_04985 [Candidatus Hydrogenedentota bacterium]
MMSFLRVLVTAVGLVLVAAAIVALLAATQWQRMTTRGLERSFSLVLGAGTTIDQVALLPRQEGIAFEGFTVMNPPEFGTEPALHFDQVEIFFDWDTLFSSTPTISLIRLHGGEVHYRYDVGRGSNMAGLTSAKEEPESTAAPDEASIQWPSITPERRFLIEQVEVGQTTLRFGSNLAPVNLPSLEVAPFELHDIAQDRPVSTPYLLAVVVRNLAGEALGMRELLAPVNEMLESELDRLDDRVEDRPESEKEQAEQD